MTLLTLATAFAARPPGLDVDGRLDDWEKKAEVLLAGPAGCWEFQGDVDLTAAGYLPSTRWTRPGRNDHHLTGTFSARIEDGEWRRFDYELKPTEEGAELDEEYDFPVWPLLGRSPEGGLGGDGEPGRSKAPKRQDEGTAVSIGTDGASVTEQGKAAMNTLHRVLDAIDPKTATSTAFWEDKSDGVVLLQDFPIHDGSRDVITMKTTVLQGGDLARSLDVTFPSRVRVGEGVVKATIFDGQGHVRTQVVDGTAVPVLENLSMSLGALGFTIGYEQRLRYTSATRCAAGPATP